MQGAMRLFTEYELFMLLVWADCIGLIFEVRNRKASLSLSICIVLELLLSHELKSKWFTAFRRNFRHLIYLRKPRRIENAAQIFRPKFIHLGLISEGFVKNIFLSNLYVTSVQFEWTCITEPISSRSKSGDFPSNSLLCMWLLLTAF